MTPISFKRHRFPPVVIQHAVWLYARFTLSFRDVEEVPAERGIDVSKKAVRQWFLKLGLQIAGNLRRSRPRPSPRWHIDEMVIETRSRIFWLWRLVDDESEELNFLVERRRYARSAKRLLRKLLKKYSFAPERMTTDKLNSYPVAIWKERLCAIHDQRLWANNRAETHISQPDGENENSVGSIRLHPPSVSWQFTPLSRMPSMSNAIYCRAQSS